MSDDLTEALRRRLADRGANGLSLGEQPHAAENCHNAGQPHLGPCVEPGYTEDDVRIAAHAMEWEYVSCTHDDGRTWTECPEHRAHAVLKALAQAGRLLPAAAQRETEYGVRWPGPWPVSAGFLNAEVARRYATDKTVEEHGTVVQRPVWRGPWMPAPSSA